MSSKLASLLRQLRTDRKATDRVKGTNLGQLDVEAIFKDLEQRRSFTIKRKDESVES